MTEAELNKLSKKLDYIPDGQMSFDDLDPEEFPWINTPETLEEQDIEDEKDR